MRGAPRAQPKKLTTVSHAPGRTQVHENTTWVFRDRNAEVVPGRTRASCVPAPTLSTLEACAPRDARALSAFAVKTEPELTQRPEEREGVAKVLLVCDLTDRVIISAEEAEPACSGYVT